MFLAFVWIYVFDVCVKILVKVQVVLDYVCVCILLKFQSLCESENVDFGV